MVDSLVAEGPACPDVEAGVVEVAGVALGPSSPVPVAGEDSVLGRGVLVAVEGAGGREIGAVIPVAVNGVRRGGTAVRPAVPPDRVTCRPAAAQEVAGREVLNPDVV